MNRCLRIAGMAMVLAASLAFAPQAAAGTTVPISMTFAEPITAGQVTGCTISPMDGLCGSGEVIPFGHAHETVVFGGACNGGCDSRTVNLAAGSILIHELFSNPACPVCGSPGRGQPGSGTITDTIVGGTGMFAGASGNLSGSVHAAGTAGVANLSGAVTLAT
jgi:hypothetical protein